MIFLRQKVRTFACEEPPPPLVHKMSALDKPPPLWLRVSFIDSLLEFYCLKIVRFSLASSGSEKFSLVSQIALAEFTILFQKFLYYTIMQIRFRVCMFFIWMNFKMIQTIDLNLLLILLQDALLAIMLRKYERIFKRSHQGKLCKLIDVQHVTLLGRH